MGFANKELDQIKAAAKEVQAIEDEYLEEELWQAIRELFGKAEANTNDMLEYLEKELWQAIRELFKNAEANTNDMLDVASVIEDEEPSVHNVGLIYAPSKHIQECWNPTMGQ